VSFSKYDGQENTLDKEKRVTKFLRELNKTKKGDQNLSENTGFDTTLYSGRVLIDIFIF
jgi:hypothetical protein